MPSTIRARRVVASLAVTAVALVGAIGVMHLPIARPLLASLERFCPVYDVSPVQVEAMQGHALSGLLGREPAPLTRPVGMQLVAETEGELRAWARTHALDCKTVTRGFHYLWCNHVPASVIGRASSGAADDREVVIAFDRSGRAVGVDIVARGKAGVAPEALTGAAIRELSGTLGEPHDVAGQFSGTALDSPFGSAMLRYRFTDYVVTLTATNLPGTGVMVREQYLAAD